jgi:hypothetical protein
VMNHASSNKTLQRYAVILLFQFRVQNDGKSNKRRTCEKRLIHLHAENARTAMRQAKMYGRRATYSYENSTGGIVYFEFVGVLDLLRLGIECQEDELWYRISEMVEPMERRKKIIPSDDDLRAFANDRPRGLPLTKLAKGRPDALLTREAKAALERMNRMP